MLVKPSGAVGADTGRSSSLPPGTRVGDRFELGAVLGAGGTGTVYEARDRMTGGVAALKLVHPDLVGDPQIRGRFAREVAILRRIEGPHLLAVIDAGEIVDPVHPERSMLYLALPKVDGPALDALVKSEGPLPFARIYDIGLQICAALRAAHGQGVIHRDLKPPNVLLRGGTEVVVVDFGMAKIMAGGTAPGTTQLTAHNALFGTPEYMSPEQARGDELDARCDVYAAGIILYELATGSVPFAGASPLVVLTAHMTEPVEPPRARAPARDVLPALEALVLHALAKDPALRYATAAALEAALAHARDAPHDVAAVRPAAFSPLGVPPSAAAAALAAPAALTPPAAATPGAPPRAALGHITLWILLLAVAAAVGAWLSLRVR